MRSQNLWNRQGLMKIGYKLPLNNDGRFLTPDAVTNQTKEIAVAKVTLPRLRSS
jgi:hypothetical protein